MKPESFMSPAERWQAQLESLNNSYAVKAALRHVMTLEKPNPMQIHAGEEGLTEYNRNMMILAAFVDIGHDYIRDMMEAVKGMHRHDMTKTFYRFMRDRLKEHEQTKRGRLDDTHIHDINLIKEEFYRDFDYIKQQLHFTIVNDMHASGIECTEETLPVVVTMKIAQTLYEAIMEFGNNVGFKNYGHKYFFELTNYIADILNIIELKDRGSHLETAKNIIYNYMTKYSKMLKAA